VAVHKVLEAVDLKASAARQRQQIEQFVTQTGLNDEDKQRAIQMVGKALGSEVLARASRADEVYRELPFTVNHVHDEPFTHVTDEGLMEGKIDLLFAEKGQWVLVDYKTDARVEVEKYMEQLRAYEAALQRVAGITLAQKLLFFLATGTVAQVP
jgi:ATP-dependent exoDNAse (exonuclease V) beta subunit